MIGAGLHNILIEMKTKDKQRGKSAGYNNITYIFQPANTIIIIIYCNYVCWK